MKRIFGFRDKFVAIASAPQVVAQITLHPCLLLQTQAYPAPATRTQFAVLMSVIMTTVSKLHRNVILKHCADCQLVFKL